MSPTSAASPAPAQDDQEQTACPTPNPVERPSTPTTPASLTADGTDHEPNSLVHNHLSER